MRPRPLVGLLRRPIRSKLMPPMDTITILADFVSESRACVTLLALPSQRWSM